MRKALLYIGILVFFAISCSKWSGAEKEQITVPEGKYLFTLRATTEYYTKTYYSDETTFKWSDNDEISVLFHNTAAGHETENEFYTLKTTTGGSGSADFSGLIDEGWEIGASDTGTKWALYPAGSHSYSAGDTYPTFNVPTVTDFTASHVSANLPMVTDGAGGVYKFYHLTNAFKFTFTNIDVSKVKLVVENQSSKYLSGNIPIIYTDKYYLANESASSASKSLTLIKDVTSKTVEFYIPYRAYNYDFQPQLTLYDASNNYTLKTITAKTDFNTISTGAREFKDRRIIVVPSISASGTGLPIISKFGVDWESVSVSASGTAPFEEIKAVKDASYIYLYLKVSKSGIVTSPSASKANMVRLYIGNDSSASSAWFWNNDTYTKEFNLGYLLKSGVWSVPNSSTAYVDGQVSELTSSVICEIKLDRTKEPLFASGSLKFGALLYYAYTGVDPWGDYVYAPAKGNSMLVLPL